MEQLLPKIIQFFALTCVRKIFTDKIATASEYQQFYYTFSRTMTRFWNSCIATAQAEGTTQCGTDYFQSTFQDMCVKEYHRIQLITQASTALTDASIFHDYPEGLLPSPVLGAACRLSVAIARECRVEVTSHYSPLRQRCVYHCSEKIGDLPLQIMPRRCGLMHVDYADTHIVMCFGL